MDVGLSLHRGSRPPLGWLDMAAELGTGMNHYKIALSIFTIAILNLHCSENSFDFATKPPEVIATDEEIEDRVDEINRKCGAVAHSSQTFTINFPNPNVTCPWNSNGNLAPLNQYFQGRIEQSVPVALPAGATLCDLDLSFADQSFRFDDMFILTFDRMVLASSYNYSPRLQKVGGLDRYDWTSIVGMEWDSTQEGVFCTGSSSGMSACSWPETDTPGSIAMSFDQRIIRTIMAIGPAGGAHKFEMISIGDNDDLDCEHSDITFTVRAHYVQ